MSSKQLQEEILSGECNPKHIIAKYQTAVQAANGEPCQVIEAVIAQILTEQQQSKIDDLTTKNNYLSSKVVELEERLNKLDAKNTSNDRVLSKKRPFSEVNLNSSSEDMSTEETAPKEYKPPPFFIDSKAAKETLVHFTGQEIQLVQVPDFKTLSDGTLKIQPKDENSYRTIRDELNKRKTEYHSHQLKSEKLYRVVIRGLHPSTEEDTIAQELATLGHLVVRATNVVIRRRKDPNNKASDWVKIARPLFFVDLSPKPNNKDIYEVKYIAYQKVTIEAPHKKKEVPQCKNCQSFGHTQSYCKHQPRCVKCAGNHRSPDCTKPKKSKPKCASCGGEHTANWKGCSVYQEAERKKSKPKCASCGGEHTANWKGCSVYQEAERKANPKPTKAIDRIRNNSRSNTVVEGKNYAQATGQGTSSQSRLNQTTSPDQDNEQQTSMQEVLNQIMRRLDRIENQLTQSTSRGRQS